MLEMGPEKVGVLSLARLLMGTEGNRDDALGAICHLLKQSIRYYDWVGIYIAEPKRKLLHLGPYAGAETEHTKIPYGKGICGQVAESHETFTVPDVRAQDNYIACSMKVKSEIVVPIMKAGKFVAQLDIDSHTANAFSDEDRAFLEALCGEMARLF
jgi:GAF domain-containing protein